MEDKQVLDLVAAILASGVMARDSKGTPKNAASTFFEVRDELLKTMDDRELGGLPIYLSQRFPRRRRRR